MSLRHMVWVLDHSEAREGARLVLLSLAEHANESDLAYPSVETVARQTRLSARAVQYALRRLEESGEIVARGVSQWQTNVYEIAGCNPCRGAVDDTKGVQSEASQIAPEPTALFEPTTEPSNAREREIEEVARHFQACFPKKRFKLDAKHAKVIGDALDARSAEDCKRAVSGLAADPYLNEHGFTGIHYALSAKGKQTIEDRIDYMAEKAPDTVDGLLAGIPSAGREMVRNRQRLVEEALLHPGDSNRAARAQDSAAYLRETFGLVATVDDGAVKWERATGGVS